MQSLNVQVHGILEGHGREGQTVMPQAVQEGIEVHLIREIAGRFRFRFFRCPTPVTRYVFPVVFRTASAVRGVGDGGKRPEAATRTDQKIRMETAERVVTAGWHETLNGNVGLVAEVGHELVQSIAVVFLREPGSSAEPGDWLKMNSTHIRRKGDGKSYQVSEIIGVHTFDHCRYQYHTKSCIATDANGIQFGLQEGRTTELPIDPILRSVKLEKDNVQTGFGKTTDIIRIASQADAVGVDLNIAAACFFGIVYQLRKIIAERGFAARKLEQRITAKAHNFLNVGLKHLQGRIVFFAAAIGKTKAAAQVAAAGDFQKNAACTALVLCAEPAALRA